MTTNKHARRLLEACQSLIDAQTPLEALQANHQLLVVLMDTHTASVADARGNNESWAKIGAALGVSKQAVQKRYGLEPDDTDTDTPPAFTPGKEHIVIYDREGRIQGYATKARGPLPFDPANPTGAADAVSDDAKDDEQADPASSGSRVKRRQPKLTVVNDD